MTDTPKLLLSHHLKTLKLPTVLREYDKVAQQCAAEGVDHVQFLARLVELELIDRERRMTGGEFSLSGVPWLEEGEEKILPPPTANCLCVKHNSALHPLD